MATTHSTSKPIVILFLAANPSTTTRLRLDEEVRAIDQALRQANYRDHFDLRLHSAVRVGDVPELLLRHQPHIVHFSGHGSPAGQLLFEDDRGREFAVPPGALSRLFAILSDNVRCVVLNACYSEPQAQAIAAHIDCVIGMPDAIGDAASRNFAASFYQALAYGRDVQTAFDLGCNRINLHSLDEPSKPKLLAERSDPRQVVFVTMRQDTVDSPPRDQAGCVGFIGSHGAKIVLWSAFLISLLVVAGLARDLVMPYLLTARATPTLTSFSYPIRVRDLTGASLSNAKVTIEVPGRSPLDDFADVNGLATIQIPVAYVDQAGKLIVEAAGFGLYVQNITLQQGQLPKEVRLSPATPSPTPTESDIVTPTPEPTSIPTATDISRATLTLALQAIVTSPTLNVRYGPYQPDPLQTPPPVVTVAAQDDTFEITGKDQPSPAWWQVRVLGQSGWVSATLVTTQGAVEDVPVMTAVVALQTHDGKYVTAWNDEEDRDWKLWGGDATSILAWEKFTLQCEPDGRAVFRTDHDRYVTAMDDSDDWDWVLRAETGRLGASERFILLDAQTKKDLTCSDVVKQLMQSEVSVALLTAHCLNDTQNEASSASLAERCRHVAARNEKEDGDWQIWADEPGPIPAKQIFTLIKQN